MCRLSSYGIDLYKTRNTCSSIADDESNLILSSLINSEKPGTAFAQSTISLSSRESPFDKRVSGILISGSSNGGLSRYSPGGMMAGEASNSCCKIFDVSFGVLGSLVGLIDSSLMLSGED
jgi:hypothetical protein